MGPTIYFYPGETTDLSKYNDNPSGTSEHPEVYYNELACKKAQKVKRFIPYCFKYMLEYVEYGCKDNDPYSVPFGRSDPEYFVLN